MDSESTLYTHADLHELESKAGTAKSLIKNNRFTFDNKTTQLSFVDLSKNKDLKEIIIETAQTHLRYIDASNCAIEKIVIKAGCPSLQTLYLQGNPIKSIEITGACDKLELIDLSQCQLKQIALPEKHLPKLKYLYLYENELVDLTPITWFFTQKNVAVDFAINENKSLQTPSIEIVGQGKVAVVNWFQQQKTQGLDYIYEAKMLIIGQGESGKTTLAHKIEDPDCALPELSDRTRGIAIKPHHFEVNTANGAKAKTIFRLNVWDFGGQEIYHSTHRFFLSKRSLYVLVSDNRKDNTQLDYWLDIVELFAQNSPIIIVLNEKDDIPTQLNITDIRSRFNNVKEIINLNFCTAEEKNTEKREKRLKQIKNLIETIEHYSKTLSHIGDAVPARWVDIHKKIESATDNYMDLKEFRALCAKNEIKQNEDVDILSGYFHDIGVVLHFQDNPLLKKTVILKPTWATNAVYRIFDHDTILPKQGRFTKTDVFKIWCDQAYCDMQDELLEIMKKFRLVYQIKETENLVAPQLLPDNKPEYNLIAQRFIQFRFNYEAFMPKGILWQTIVALHHHIKNHDWVWKTGVILETENTQAEIIENNVLRLITIKIVGSNKTSLLSIIRETINNINNSYYKLKVEQLIPCNCTVCQNIEPPHFYKYSSLLNRKEKGKKTIECDVSFEDVNVQSLLDEVIKEKHDFEPEYNIKNIGTLLKESFNDVKFQEFCMFHFPEVQNGWGSEYDKTQKIMALLDYCKRHRRIDALLRLMENENPAQFDLHKPYR